MKEQTSIPKHKLGRAASLTAAGARVGVNYLKYAGKKAITGKETKGEFHEATAAEAFGTFSKLKGGPLKLAQMLSMDRNLLPEPYVREFSKAQYSAPPLSYPLVVKTFRTELGQAPSELFDSFSQTAVAGASIGQVHKAQIDDHEYAIKVQYPGVADSIHSDLAIVKPLAMRLFKLDARAINPYLKEVEERLTEETDYVLERKRSEELAEKSKHVSGIRFPNFHPELSTGRILTMDWVHGEVLDQFFERNTDQALANQIGQSLWDFYHHQVHTLRVYHAAPHPGNFKVHENELWILDFGCVKALPDAFYRQYFSLMEPEIFNDPEKFESLLYEIGLLLPDDSPSAVKKLTSIFHESVDLLSRPFQQETFDFGDESYFKELADFGDRTRDDAELQALNSARGNADALYLNRTYFGLYNLAGALKAEIKTTRPEL
jgi:predicted unusual protein kinase regulating ubiquinone biosynthesis (AarF/ABC1/UbiB family)